MSQISYAADDIRVLTTSLPELTAKALDSTSTLIIYKTYILTGRLNISKSTCSHDLTIYIMPEASLTISNIKLTSGNLTLICLGSLTINSSEEKFKLADGKLKLICSGNLKINANLQVTPDSILDLSTAQEITMSKNGSSLILDKGSELIIQDTMISAYDPALSPNQPDNPVVPDKPVTPIDPDNPVTPVDPNPNDPDIPPVINPDFPFVPIDPNPTLSNIVSPTSIKIIGNESVLVAPPVQVFDEKISVEGTWAIDCAYPQWFTSARLIETVDLAIQKTNDEAKPTYTGTKTDWAPAINKAIKMKNSGLVSLPRGVYIIKSTIFTHIGIRLVGEGASSRKVTKKDDKNKTKTLFEVTGTVLMADLAARDNFAKGNYRVKWNDSNSNSDPNTFKIDKKSSEPYMMALNFESEYSIIRDSIEAEKNSLQMPECIQPSNILITSSNTPAIIEYIYFTTSREPNLQIPADEEINAIYAIGYFSFRNLVFHGIGTALYVLPQYSDCQELIDCHYYRPWIDNAIIEKSPEEVDRFAICRLGNGDAFRMEGCHIIGHSSIGSIYLNKCFGGSLVSNILNSHVVISGCLNITYSGNHSESGSQLMILCSTVDATANYFEKGLYPAIRIWGNVHQNCSILNLSTSKFIFCDGPRFEIEKKTKTDQWLSNLKKRFENINQHDIEVDDVSILTLNQNYRSLQLLGNNNSIPTSLTYGLLIGKTTTTNRNISDLEEFNGKSGFLTPWCQIARNAVISNNTFIPATPGTINVSYGPKLNSHVQWTGSLATVSISYEAAMLAPGQTINNSPNKSLTKLGDPLIRESNSLDGILLVISAKTYQDRGNLYVRRTITPTGNISGAQSQTIDEVYVPLCFSTPLYDNGVTLSSFKWQTVTTDKSQS